MPEKKKTIIVLSVCAFLLLSLFFCSTKFSYFYWHCYFKHKLFSVTPEKQLNTKVPIKTIPHDPIPDPGWEEIDFLEFTMNLPMEPIEKRLNQSMTKNPIMVFRYPKMDIIISGIGAFRIPIRFPNLLPDGTVTQVSPFQAEVIQNEVSTKDIKFLNSQLENKIIILKLNRKSFAINNAKCLFLFKTAGIEGKCFLPEVSPPIIGLYIYSRKMNKGVNITVKIKKKLSDAELYEIVETLLQGIKFSNKFPNEKALNDHFNKFAGRPQLKK